MVRVPHSIKIGCGRMRSRKVRCKQWMRGEELWLRYRGSDNSKKRREKQNWYFPVFDLGAHYQIITGHVHSQIFNGRSPV